MTDTVPNRVDNFGSKNAAPVEEQEVGLTVETIDSHSEKLPHPTGYRILILPFSPPSVTKSGIHLAKQTVDRESLATVVG